VAGIFVNGIGCHSIIIVKILMSGRNNRPAAEVNGKFFFTKITSRQPRSVTVTFIMNILSHFLADHDPFAVVHSIDIFRNLAGVIGTPSKELSDYDDGMRAAGDVLEVFHSYGAIKSHLQSLLRSFTGVLFSKNLNIFTIV